ncbi:MAG: four helix bundle protein [Cytophagaceae bacterium]|nr:four helix bundle protein [Cytophagaceae bacterium]
MGFKFEKLQVWQKAIDLTEKVHNLTKDFPKDETYVLSSQIKRAADSIALNIAEGSTGQTNPEFQKFLGYAIRSNAEVVSCLHIGRKRGIISEENFNIIYKETELITVMTKALRKSLN